MLMVSRYHLDKLFLVAYKFIPSSLNVPLRKLFPNFKILSEDRFVKDNGIFPVRQLELISRISNFFNPGKSAK